jgi:transposase
VFLVQIGDNASIHGAEEVRPYIDMLLDAVGVRLAFQPKYSPELNPCELIFGHAKRYMREERGNGTFVEEIGRAFAQIKKEEVLRCYDKCINHYDEEL